MFEYLFQVPANLIGHTPLSVRPLKILQEVITPGVFVPFKILYLNERMRLDYPPAGLCLLAAVFFVLRGAGGSGNPRAVRPPVRPRRA